MILSVKIDDTQCGLVSAIRLGDPEVMLCLSDWRDLQCTGFVSLIRLRAL